MDIYNHKNLFLENEFRTEYYNIINNVIALNRKRYKRSNPEYVYYEAHHVLPKSLFPEYTKEKWNIVLLTPEEHIKCHRLLINFTENEYYHKIVYAAWCMIIRKTGDRDEYKVSDEEYGELKRKWSESISAVNTGRVCSDETKEKISAANKGRQPSPLAIENSLKARENYTHSVEIKQIIGNASKGNQNTKNMNWWVKDGNEILCREFPGDGWTMGRLGHSDETKIKISKAGKGRVRSEESKKSQSEKMTGYVWPKDFGGKVSAGKKGKTTNQQEIMGRKYANMLDKDFYLHSSQMKSLLAKNRAKNLRDKWMKIIMRENAQKEDKK